MFKLKNFMNFGLKFGESTNSHIEDNEQSGGYRVGEHWFLGFGQVGLFFWPQFGIS